MPCTVCVAARETFKALVHATTTPATGPRAAAPLNPCTCFARVSNGAEQVDPIKEGEESHFCVYATKPPGATQAYESDPAPSPSIHPGHLSGGNMTWTRQAIQVACVSIQIVAVV